MDLFLAPCDLRFWQVLLLNHNLYDKLCSFMVNLSAQKETIVYMQRGEFASQDSERVFYAKSFIPCASLFLI